MNNKTELKEKLKEKLKEIFQFENEDLDFGIYRILNYKRKEIEKKVNKEMRKNKEKVNITLDAYILSVTPYMSARKRFNATKEEFEKYHVIFQEDEEYLQRMFQKALDGD